MQGAHQTKLPKLIRAYLWTMRCHVLTYGQTITVFGVGVLAGVGLSTAVVYAALVLR